MSAVTNEGGGCAQGISMELSTAKLLSVSCRMLVRASEDRSSPWELIHITLGFTREPVILPLYTQVPPTVISFKEPGKEAI